MKSFNLTLAQRPAAPFPAAIIKHVIMNSVSFRFFGVATYFSSNMQKTPSKLFLNSYLLNTKQPLSLQFLLNSFEWDRLITCFQFDSYQAPVKKLEEKDPIFDEDEMEKV